jgi:hypothetical protein
VQEDVRGAFLDYHAGCLILLNAGANELRSRLSEVPQDHRFEFQFNRV